MSVRSTFPFKCLTVVIIIVIISGFILLPVTALAVVGNAEGFDRFTVEDLEDFHRFLLTEEKKYGEGKKNLKKYEQLMERYRKLKEKGKSDVDQEQLKLLKKEILSPPDRDRIQIQLGGDYTYQMNVERSSGQTKGDSIYTLRTNVNFDVSGRKTNLQLESFFGKEWNYRFSEKDFFEMGERIRFRRPYFKKTNQTIQLNATRNSSKTSEIDASKVRWDLTARKTLNIPITRRLAINGEADFTKRLFIQEAFDQDSEWQVVFSPSLFWNATPKVRFSAGYTYGASRIRTKTGDTNSHTLDLAYFGRVTRKSSLSFTFSRQHQTPRSTANAVTGSKIKPLMMTMIITTVKHLNGKVERTLIRSHS